MNARNLIERVMLGEDPKEVVVERWSADVLRNLLNHFTRNIKAHGLASPFEIEATRKPDVYIVTLHNPKDEKVLHKQAKLGRVNGGVLLDVKKLGDNTFEVVCRDGNETKTHFRVARIIWDKVKDSPEIRSLLDAMAKNSTTKRKVVGSLRKIIRKTGDRLGIKDYGHVGIAGMASDYFMLQLLSEVEKITGTYPDWWG